MYPVPIAAGAVMVRYSMAPWRPPVKVNVNSDMCEGHGKCEMAAPEVFKLGPDDVSIVLLADVRADLKDKVDRAIRLCPRQAISWEK